MVKRRIYGLMAEFTSPEEVLAAAHTTHDAGYRRIDAFSPIPVEGLAEAVGFDWTILPTLVFFGGLGGGLTGFGMCWYANVISFPLNIGGKPFNSWPMWIPITFELTILGAALTAVFGMLALNGLPTPYHPTFNVERFAAMIRQFSAEAQMIVVTHNKRTMELADRLYGVTMREPGVSAIVSAELSPLAPELSLA